MEVDLFQRLVSHIQNGEQNENIFNDLALELFNHQFERNIVYRRICQSRGMEKPKHWQEIPCLTTDLFKKQRLFCGNYEQAVKIFQSSGTSNSERSQHYLSEKELKLYELSLWKTFSQAFNLTENQNLNYFVLTASPEENPNSSLIYMFEEVRQRLNFKSNPYFFNDGSLQIKELNESLQSACQSQIPILIAGTAFAFVHLLESNSAKIKLPPGSALMETGGFKGKSREIPKAELYAELAEFFGLSPQDIVGQYGMSELGTQYYDSSYRAQSNSAKARFKSCPPWSRVRVLNPGDLTEEVQENEMGLLCHYDLANIDSMPFVLSGDLGIKRADGQFEIIGRANKLSLKGCSLMTDLK